MNYSTILVADNGLVRTITLNRPERRNAMTPEMQTELIAAMGDAVASGCRVLVLAGAGQAFCSGLDLSALQAMQEKTAAEHRADAERIAKLFRTLYELPIPTIAAVQGAATAGGTGLAVRLRLHPRHARCEIWIHRGADRLCARDGIGFSCLANWRQAQPGPVVDRPSLRCGRGVAAGVGE